MSGPVPDPATVAAQLAAARARYTEILMSDPSAPGYDRLCANAEEEVRGLQATMDWAPAPGPSLEVALGVASVAAPGPGVACDAPASLAATAAEAATAAPWGDLASADPNPRPSAPCFTIPVDPSVRPRSPAAVRDFSALLEPVPRDRTWQALWRAANDLRETNGNTHSGCDCTGLCDCARLKVEADMAAERRAKKEFQRALAAAIKRGECTCNLEYSEEDQKAGAMCQLCQQEAENVCDYCNSFPCRPSCCANCGGCQNCISVCSRCGEEDGNGDCACVQEYERQMWEEQQPGKDKYSRQEEEYRRWKADQHKYGP